MKYLIIAFMLACNTALAVEPDKKFMDSALRALYPGNQVLEVGTMTNREFINGFKNGKISWVKHSGNRWVMKVVKVDDITKRKDTLLFVFRPSKNGPAVFAAVVNGKNFSKPTSVWQAMTIFSQMAEEQGK